MCTYVTEFAVLL